MQLQRQQQQLEVLVLEQLERAEEARAAAMKDEELSYRRDRLCCWGWQHKIVQDSTERAADSFSLRLSPAILPYSRLSQYTLLHAPPHKGHALCTHMLELATSYIHPCVPHLDCQCCCCCCRLREALYNHAAGKFRGKDFQGAVKFFAATLEVCEVSRLCT
jgi:hypothetical protein